VLGDLKGSSSTMHEGFLFKSNKLCIPRSPLWELLVGEAYGGALPCHFGLNKIVTSL